MQDFEAINVYFQGPELTPELTKQLRGAGFVHGYEGSPLSVIMDGTGFGYDRFQVNDGILWGAIDGFGTDSEYLREIIAWFTNQAKLHHNSYFMLVGEPSMTEEDEEEYRHPTPVLIFNQGFTKENTLKVFCKVWGDMRDIEPSSFGSQPITLTSMLMPPDGGGCWNCASRLNASHQFSDHGFTIREQEHPPKGEPEQGGDV